MQRFKIKHIFHFIFHKCDVSIHLYKKFITRKFLHYRKLNTFEFEKTYGTIFQWHKTTREYFKNTLCN